MTVFVLGEKKYGSLTIKGVFATAEDAKAQYPAEEWIASGDEWIAPNGFGFGLVITPWEVQRIQKHWVSGVRDEADRSIQGYRSTFECACGHVVRGTGRFLVDARAHAESQFKEHAPDAVTPSPNDLY